MHESDVDTPIAALPPAPTLPHADAPQQGIPASGTAGIEDPADAIAPAIEARIGPPLVVADEGWQDTTPAPWRRYFARAFDVMVLSTLLWASIETVIGLAAPHLHDALYAHPLALQALGSTIASALLLVPINALLIGTTGLTPGKWIFGTRVTRRDGRPIGLRAALGRETGVWFFGLGMGLPLISVFTLLASNVRLADEHATRWDAGRAWVVTHRPPGIMQMLLVAGGVLAWIALRMLIAGAG